jgi:integrase
MKFFITRCLPACGLDLNDWSEDAAGLVTTKLGDKGTVVELCGNASNRKKKFKWLQVFCAFIVPCLPGMQLDWIVIQTKEELAKANAFDDGSDHHRISTDDLEAIEKEAAKSPLDHICMMLMVTTGMRVGGLVGIRTEHIADFISNKVTVKQTGRTLEKGGKWFSFVLSGKLRKIIYEWITVHRPASPSPFLFPSVIDNVSALTTACIRIRFTAICHKIGLSGDEFHPHALRHTYAHLLLECGNKIEVVSKLLGHSKTETTEKFYLKENAAEVADRANIPWLQGDDGAPKRKSSTPAFLKPSGNDIRRVKRRKKKRKDLASLDMFNKLDDARRAEASA